MCTKSNMQNKDFGMREMKLTCSKNESFKDQNPFGICIKNQKLLINGEKSKYFGMYEIKPEFKKLKE